MSKPPPSPPSSDIDGVHQDGTRPGTRLDPEGQHAGHLDEARKQSAARPDPSRERARDDRSG